MSDYLEGLQKLKYAAGWDSKDQKKHERALIVAEVMEEIKGSIDLKVRDISACRDGSSIGISIMFGDDEICYDSIDLG